MRPNTVKERWRAGEPVRATWCTTGDPLTAEVLGNAGFDAVLLDMQHGFGIDPRTAGWNPDPEHPRGGYFALMHAKTVVVDAERCIVGSANFTDAGTTRNIEAGIVVRSPAFARALLGQWRGLIARGWLQRVDDPDPTVRAILRAQQPTVAAVLAVEYALLGLVSGLVGVLGANGLTWGVLTQVMQLSYEPRPAITLAALGLTIVGVSLAGVAGNLGALRARPAVVLRGD